MKPSSEAVGSEYNIFLLLQLGFIPQVLTMEIDDCLVCTPRWMTVVVHGGIEAKGGVDGT